MSGACFPPSLKDKCGNIRRTAVLGRDTIRNANRSSRPSTRTDAWTHRNPAVRTTRPSGGNTFGHRYIPCEYDFRAEPYPSFNRRPIVSAAGRRGECGRQWRRTLGTIVYAVRLAFVWTSIGIHPRRRVSMLDVCAKATKYKPCGNSFRFIANLDERVKEMVSMHRMR